MPPGTGRAVRRPYAGGMGASTRQGRRAFVRGETRLLRPPLLPELRLHLADEPCGLWERTEGQLAGTVLAPPFWAFAWAGGQALARHVLDHPDLVAGRRVLDVASGSGVVAIAAALAGAESVTASEIDGFAVAAVRLNARANGVTLAGVVGDLLDGTAAHDVVLAGDVCYERSLAARMLPFLRRAARAGATVLVGDPGRAYLPTTGVEHLATYVVPVSPELESGAVKTTRVLRVLAGS